MASSDGQIVRFVRSHVFLTGRVQGVFFRATAARQALAHDVVGWIRNLPDGRVEAVFEGPEDAVATLVHWCGQGPPGARVDGIQAHREPAEGLDGFEIR